MKKKILFVYYTMMLGGSTTSLLSLLDNIDYDKYDVDLLLYRNEGPLISYIPEKVNLLPEAHIKQSKTSKILKGVLSGRIIRACMHGKRHFGRFRPTLQGMSYAQLLYSRKLKAEYDVAVGFLELWSDVYANLRVNAKKRISWIHVDYEKAHYIAKTDEKMLSHSDVIVHVSEECKQNFINALPSLADKCVYIPNILTKSFILKRTGESIEVPPMDKDSLKLLSVCRVAIDHKGLDRGVRALKRLKDEGKKIVWAIIGDGPDVERLKALIAESGMEKEILLLGKTNSPFGCYDKFDAFFVPSRFEGKPMAVTEAQMLSLPPIVTEYASAHEQVENGVDGIVTENSEDGIYAALSCIYEDRALLLRLKENTAKRNYDNTDDLSQIYTLLDT